MFLPSLSFFLFLWINYVKACSFVRVDSSEKAWLELDPVGSVHDVEPQVGCGLPWVFGCWNFLKVVGKIGLFKDQVVWSFLFGFDYGSDSMGFDLWRLFANVDANHVQFLFLQKYQGRKNKEEAILIMNLGFFLFIFLNFFFGENNYVGNKS